jgi:hypothetical protein
MIDGFATPEELGLTRKEYVESVQKTNKKVMRIAEKFMKENEVAMKKLAKIEHQELAAELALELRSWAQNEEMVDQYFTKHGTICNQAADLLELLANERVD